MIDLTKERKPQLTPEEIDAQKTPLVRGAFFCIALMVLCFGGYRASEHTAPAAASVALLMAGFFAFAAILMGLLTFFMEPISPEGHGVRHD